MLNDQGELAQGLTALWVFNGPGCVNLVTGEATTTSGAIYAQGMHGTAIRTTADADYATIAASAKSVIPLSNAATVSIWKRKMDATNRASRFLSDGSNNGLIMQIYSDGFFYRRFGTTDPFPVSGSWGDDRLVMAVSPSANVLYQNGAVKHSQSVSQTTYSNASDTALCLGDKDTADAADRDDFFTAAIWNWTLSEAEVSSWSNFPWQLVRADPVRFYSLPSGGGTSQPLAASGTATASGTAAAAAQVALAGVGVSLASGSASIAASRPLAASGASTASGTAKPSATKPLSASGSSAASASAAVKLDIAVAGVGVALVTGAASITGGSAGAIQAAGSATATGSAATAAQVKLSAIGLAVSSGSAAVSSGTAGDLSAAGSAQAGGSASPVTTVTISAAGLAQAAGAAGLSVAVLLAGAGAARSAGNAVLAAQLSALASGAAQAGGSASLASGSAGSLEASGAAVATGAAALKLSVRLAGLAAAQASGTATLEGGTAGEIRAQGTAQSSGGATASADVVLTAAGFVRAMGVGAVVLQIPLAAFGAASATGAAVIYQPPSLLRLAARVRPVGSVVASVIHV